MLFPLWLILAFLSEILWTASNFFDKLILNKLNVKPIVFTTIANLSSIFPAAIALIFFDLETWNSNTATFGILLGALIGCVTYFYAKILDKCDAPFIGVLFQLTPVVILLIEFLIFKTVFTLTVYIGIILTLLGGTLIATKNNSEDSNKVKINYTLIFLAISCCLLWAISVSIQDYLSTKTSIINLFLYIKIGEVLFALSTLISSDIRDSCLHTKRILLMKSFGLNILSEAFNGLALFSFIWALSIGSMTLITTVHSTQPIISILAVITINKFYPNSIPDEYSHKNTVFKILCMLLVVFGIYLIT